MMPPLQTKNETFRINAVKRYLKLHLNRENKLQDIAMLACNITQTPVSLISLMDKKVQWITTKHGYEIDSLPRANSFCTETIKTDEVLVVKDSRLDERFKNNPIVNADPSARFYAGTPLKSYDGYNIGTLCVLDVKPKSISKRQALALQALARQVTNLMELHLNLDLLQQSINEIETKNKTLKEVAQFQSHEFRGPLASVMAVMNLIKYEGYPNNKEYLMLMESAVNLLDNKIHTVVDMATRPA